MTLTFDLLPTEAAALAAVSSRAGWANPQAYLEARVRDLIGDYVRDVAGQLRGPLIKKLEAVDLDKLTAIETAIDTALIAATK